MPGGYLSYGIYQYLGGERDLGTFWLQLGLPSVAVIGASYFLVVQRIVSQNMWMACSVVFIAAMALAVGVRVIF